MLILALVTAVGGLLRVAGLGEKSFWIDELLSICHAQSLESIRALVTPQCGNAHPPLYFLLLRVWSAYGSGEVYLRMLSVLVGIAVIPMTYLVGKALLDEWVGMIGASLVAISPFLLLYDRELRMYSLLTLLAICSLYWFIKAVRCGRLRDWSAYTVVSILAVYAHYHAVLVVLCEWAYCLAMHRRRRDVLLKLHVCLGLIGLSFALWLPAFLYQVMNPHVFALDGPDKFPVVAGGRAVAVLYLLYALSLGQSLMPWRVIAIVGMLAFAIITIRGVRAFRERKDASVFIGLCITIPVIVGFTMSSPMPRYYVFLAPLYYLLVAGGVLSIKGKWVRWTAIGLLLGPLGVSGANYYGNRDFHILAQIDPWREVGKYLQSSAQRGDCIVAIGSYRPLAYYTGEFVGFRRPIYGENFKDSQACMNGDPEQRMWLVTADPALQDLAEAARWWLDAHYTRQMEAHYLRDPHYEVKARLFKKGFLEHRIKIYVYGKA